MSSAMSVEEFCAFMQAQRMCIAKDKAFEEKQTSATLHDEWTVDWINNSSEDFRHRWNQSKCRTCSHVMVCGHYVRSRCRKHTTIK